MRAWAPSERLVLLPLVLLTTSFTTVHWSSLLLALLQVYWASPASTGPLWKGRRLRWWFCHIQASLASCSPEHPSPCVSIRQIRQSAYVSICEHTWAYAASVARFLCQHTWAYAAYVSIREHTLQASRVSYVSIREHTLHMWAYVSIRCKHRAFLALLMYVIYTFSSYICLVNMYI